MAASISHIRCIAHFIQLAVKEGIRQMSNQIHSLMSIVRAVRSSVKRRDHVLQTREKLKTSIEILRLDVTTWWLSTLEISRQAYEARDVLHGTLPKISELRKMAVTNEKFVKKRF